VHTPLWEQVAEEISDKRGLSTERLFAEREAAVPSGVLTEAADVAATVAFLLSDDARQINASELVIDGGLIGCSSFHIGASVAHRLGQKGDYR
jgi:2,3-dihydro-2,3-dihydroxybenzoate dehydrogenase